jgi:hypothetical protein
MPRDAGQFSLCDAKADADHLEFVVGHFHSTSISAVNLPDGSRPGDKGGRQI